MTSSGEQKLSCGIVMPISPIEDCSASHWEDVRSIISEAAEMGGFEPLLVSEANDVGLIHKRIFQNLYTNDIVVCDVSRKNPNVMFELGVRLAFDKPVVIIKDDKTDYSFDTSNIEHLSYPSELRYQTIVDFKLKLASKLKSTFEASKDKDYVSVLRHFGEFKTVKIAESEVSANEYILDEIKNLRAEIRRLSPTRLGIRRPNPPHGLKPPFIDVCLRDNFDKEDEIAKKISVLDGVSMVVPYARGNHTHLAIDLAEDKSENIISVRNKIREMGLIPALG